MLEYKIWNATENMPINQPFDQFIPPLKNVLIVDDDVDFRLSLSEVLVANGYRVLTAKNGEDALNLLNNISKLPDLILIDLLMPILGGLEFRKIQLNHHLFSSVPVVFVSGNGYVVGERSFQKPILIHQFLKEVEEILNLTFH
jgi:CheY-like chemotaxis protein